MRVFVAGATGAVGRRLVPQLVAAGHTVVGTTRSPAKAGGIEALGAVAAVLDGLDAGAVGEAVARAEPEVIVHQMTALAGMPDFRRFDRWFAATNRLRTEGTEHLLAAAAATGVRRFVAQSFAGWVYQPVGGPVKTEDDPLDPDPLPAQRRTLDAIKFLERAVTAAPLSGIVLRYGGFYGPGASEQMVEMVRKRKLPLIGDGSAVWSFLHVDDAASATVAAIDRGAPGIYNVTDDDPALVRDWLPYLAEALGAKRPLRVPTWLGRLAAGPLAVAAMTTVRGASNAKFRSALDWKPEWSSWRDGFRKGLG